MNFKSGQSQISNTLKEAASRLEDPDFSTPMDSLNGFCTTIGCHTLRILLTPVTVHQTCNFPAPKGWKYFQLVTVSHDRNKDNVCHTKLESKIET